MNRRTLIRLLVGLGIGVPILVEAITFLGLVETRLFGGGDGRDGGTPTAGVRRVGVGDELLPGTPQSETVTDAIIRGAGDPWVFTMTVSVGNGTEAAYELRLRTLTLGNGTTVAGAASTGRIEAGESGQVTGAWEIPSGSTPDRLDVVAIEYGDGTPSETEERVVLSKVPVRGS